VIDIPYTWNYVVICAVQGLAVLAPRLPPTLPWLRARPIFGLIPLAGIGGGVLLLGNVEGGAAKATDLAAVATPILAIAGVVALRWWWLALATPVLYLIAWKDPHTRWADFSADALIILACGTLAWLTGIIAPRRALIVGIFVATAVDVYQILQEDVQPVARALSAAQPAAGLPRLQEVVWNTSSMGWGDVFLGALLGVVVLQSRERILPYLAAAVTFVAHAAWGYMFHYLDILPGTVPVAFACVVALAYEHVAQARRGVPLRAGTLVPDTKEV
jgi:hypothetical protein